MKRTMTVMKCDVCLSELDEKVDAYAAFIVMEHELSGFSLGGPQFSKRSPIPPLGSGDHVVHACAKCAPKVLEPFGYKFTP